MKINRIFNKLFCKVAIICATLSSALTACQAGLTYDEAPENVYSEVGVSDFKVYAREVFQNKIYAINWDKWVDNYMQTKSIGWGFNLTQESDSSAPGGTLYVINVKANTSVVYSTANKGYLFDGNKFSGDFELINPENNRSREVRLPVKQNEVVCEMHLVDAFNCYVERIGNAPELGTPADYTKPVRYLVKNLCYRPDGVDQVTRLYEVRITFEDQN